MRGASTSLLSKARLARQDLEVCYLHKLVRFTSQVVVWSGAQEWEMVIGGEEVGWLGGLPLVLA